jgi:hypothetical protein
LKNALAELVVAGAEIPLVACPVLDDSRENGGVCEPSEIGMYRTNKFDASPFRGHKSVLSEV